MYIYLRKVILQCCLKLSCGPTGNNVIHDQFNMCNVTESLQRSEIMNRDRIIGRITHYV